MSTDGPVSIPPDLWPRAGALDSGIVSGPEPDRAEALRIESSKWDRRSYTLK